MRKLLAVLAVLATTTFLSHPAAAIEARQAVYVNLADSLQGPLTELGASLRTAFEAGRWEVLAEHDVAAEPGECAFAARVLVLNEPGYAAAMLAHGPLAAFAVPVRLVLYQDEAGTHLAAVNPHSIDRTIVAETGTEADAERMLREVERIAAGAVRGHFVRRPFGQFRERGLIGRTMGIMAGGPFTGKVKRVHTTPGGTTADVARVADQVWSGFERGAGKGRWQVRGIYRLDLAAQGVVVIGVSGAALEAKSFAIVGAGGDDRRSHYRCPGLAHAAAYPIEVLIFAEQGATRVAVIDGMYRMKMYFEDAGKMKFAANMGMPGSVEDEVRGLILTGVGAKP